MRQTVYSLTKTSLFSLLVSVPIWACNASHVMGAGGAGAVYTMSADTMERGGVYIGINREYIGNRSLSDNAIIDAIEGGAEHLHSIDATDNYSLSLSYGLSDRLTLNINLPYVIRWNIRAGELHDEGMGLAGEVHAHGDIGGLGDLSILVQYKVYDNSHTKVALLGGLKLPTGKSDLKEGDEAIEADLQPGSGSWDYFAGVALTHEFEDFSFHASTLYKYNTEGVEESRLGDIFTYNAAIAFHLMGAMHTHNGIQEEHHGTVDYSVDCFAELNGEIAEPDSFGGKDAQNTGHHLLYFTTGLQLLTQSEYSAFVSFSVPLYQHFKGLQNDIRYKASIGIGRHF